MEEIRILLVDDDEDEYILLRDMITAQGVRQDSPQLILEWAATYEQALEMFQTRQHEVYLIDYNLGERDGLELLREAEALKLNAPVIMLTGHATYAVDVAAMQSGAADFLVKDQINLPLLERSIRYAIEQKGAQDALEARVQERTRELARANRELKAEINRRRQVEQNLRESELKFRALANTTSAAILIVQDRKISYANPASKYIVGYPPEELIGKEIAELLHPNYRYIVDQKGVFTGGSNGTPSRIELKVVRKDGGERWVDVSAGRMDYQGSPAFVVTAFDITERDLAEQELRKAKAELELRVEERTAELKKTNIQLAAKAAEVSQHAEELDALNAATNALLSTLDLETLLGQILDAAQSAIPAAEQGWLHLVEPKTGKLKIRAATDTDLRIRTVQLPQGQDYPLLVAQEKKPILIHDTRADESFTRRNPGIQYPAFRSAIIAPLILDGETFGVMSLSASTPDTFTEDDLRLLTAFSATATSALQNAVLHSEVQRLAITDSLTGVYNRRAFVEIGEREIDRFHRFGRTLAAVMLDVDNFKAFNDHYGHAAGDAILRAVAERIKTCIRDVDVLARYGGDEYVILLPESEWLNITEITRRITGCVSEKPVMIDGEPVTITISLGAARATQSTSNLDELLARADAAMYAAKNSGKNQVRVAADEIN